jgi:hypothetical protein
MDAAALAVEGWDFNRDGKLVSETAERWQSG